MTEADDGSTHWSRSRRVLLAGVLAAAATLAPDGARAAEGPPTAAGVELITAHTPWRVFLMCSSLSKKGRGKETTEYTPSPPAAWAQADFDDSGWGRYGPDLLDSVGGYGYGQLGATRLLCLRTRFGIADPAQVRDVKLEFEYRGGVVVYVNGQEAARQHLPAGKLEPITPAEAYPDDAFVNPAGEGLPQADRPASENKDRYEKRVRRLSLQLPKAALRRGSNTIALELHHAPVGKMRVNTREEWSTAGLCAVRLASLTGAGVIPYGDALRAITFSNATPMDTVAVTPGKRQAGFLWWGITITPMGLTRGNPFEPVQPIRAVAPRGGACSAQIVASGPGPFSGLKAAITALKHERSGATLPAGAVQVRYATQDKDEVFCNALQASPADGPPVQPVWVLVDVPRSQVPGWYTGALTVSVGAQTARVPVQILVAAWTVPEPKDNATLVSMYQSPETLAEYYKVETWSDKHFALIEHSMKTMALMGNDVLLVPVITDNYLHHKNGMVRWVRKAGGYEPEFSALERYFDIQSNVFGRPKVVTLSLWKHAFGTRTYFRGMKSDSVGPCMVTELEPGTGRMKPLEAPHFGKPGSEEFWKTMIEGVRRIVKARGCDDRFLLLGEPFDSRPLEPVVDFFKKIEPGMRWQMYAHFDGGEPAPKDGKFTALGGFEIGFRINPNGGALPELDRRYPNVPASEYLVAQCQRTEIHHTSSPLSYRRVMRTSGTLARIGLDFWPMFEDRGRRRSYYSCPPNEGWLWRGHVPALTAPGPDGAVRTTRGQMLLEGLQESELLITFLRTKTKASPEIAARIEQRLAARRHADLVGKALSQAMISQDLYSLAAREYALGAELAGMADDGDWEHPPAVQAGSQ
jgi:hypothetical protein